MVDLGTLVAHIFSLGSLPVGSLYLPELEILNLFLSTVTRWELLLVGMPSQPCKTIQ